jgi:hypothetical protein
VPVTIVGRSAKRGRSDCYASLAIVGTPTVVNDRKVECRNGDPACDLDGDPCDWMCSYGVALCLNDPVDLAKCTPPFPPDALVRVKTRKDAQVLEVPPLDTAGCGAVSIVEVPLRLAHRTGVVKPGRSRLKVIAISPKRPRRDRDKVQLVCLPPESACPE